MKSRIPLYLGILQVLIALGALPAGFAMIKDPSGTAIQMTTELLVNSPFSNFLIPGLFLFIVNGLGNILGAILSFRKMKRAGDLAFLLGILMMLWIGFQIFWIGYCSILQPIYFVVGIVETLMSYWLIRQKKAGVLA